MIAITANALYTALRRRGTTRQLAGAVITCVLSALLLLPALVWYNSRFSSQQATLSIFEVELVLIYIALCGWIIPLSATIFYCLFSPPRTSLVSIHLPSQRKRTTRGNATALGVSPPRRQPGVPVPYVFGEDVPWGWLEHRRGRFQGQRLALKRAVATLGREEDNDIWLDDDTASRYHAELAWSEGQVFLTDCDSLNGVLRNGRRIRGSVIIEAGDLIEIGSHGFLFEKAEAPGPLNEQDDPLSHHAWRLNIPQTPSEIAFENSKPLPGTMPTKPLGSESNSSLPRTRPLGHSIFAADFASQPSMLKAKLPERSSDSWEDTAVLSQVSKIPQPALLPVLLVIRGGEMEGKSFLLDRTVLIIGRSSECDVVIDDGSISRRHAQFLRQAAGDFVLDLSSRNGTKVNNELLQAPRLLKQGDMVSIGNVNLEYTSVLEAHTTPLPLSELVPPMSGPVYLRLPSKPNRQ